MTVWFATGNVHKKKELEAILAAAIPPNAIPPEAITSSKTKGFELKIPADAGLAFDPEETGSTFLENALLKAQELHRLLEELKPPLYTSGDPVIADDSGLCVDALGGRPGIHSARYPESTLAYGGKGLDAAGKNALLLSELGDSDLRSARFVCAMVLYYGKDRFCAVQEIVEGELVRDMPKGSGGFGYDPIFYIPPLGRTAAELSEEEKNRLSHRGKAGRAIGRLLC